MARARISRSERLLKSLMRDSPYGYKVAYRFPGRSRKLVDRSQLHSLISLEWASQVRPAPLSYHASRGQTHSRSFKKIAPVECQSLNRIFVVHRVVLSSLTG